MKFLHIFNVSKGYYFAKLLIDTINSNLEFDKNEHYFCLRNKEFFESLNYSNIIFDDSKGALVAKYIDSYDFIFLHGLDNPDEIVQLPKKKIDKIIWRTWGGSSGLYSIRRKNLLSFFKDIKKRHKRKIIVDKMKIVCGANAVDLIDTRQKCNHFFEFPYPIKETIADIKFCGLEINKNDVNILVGHSAYYTDKHEIVLTQLKKWIDYDINIIVPLTYGNEEYKRKIIDKWKPIFGKKIRFLEEQMPFNEYKYLISNMDLVFIVGDRSYALGNIDLVLKNRINLVVSKRGVIRKGLEFERIKCHLFNSKFFRINPEKFKEKANYHIEGTSFCSDYMKDVKKLTKIFEFLKAGKEN